LRSEGDGDIFSPPPFHNVAVVGETLSRYHLVAHLGSGAMGDVYRAEDQRLRRTVALKVVRPASDPEETSRLLLAEARAGSALTHPNIAVVYEVDEVEHHGAMLSFIAMEYVAGRTLADLAAEGPLALDTILDVGRQVADALAAAHAYGLVHKDIKPSNVMVTENGLVKVLDFGVARWSAPMTDTAPTQAVDPLLGSAAGTLSYMSPEQITGRPLDGRSDMFSLGVVIYELLAGHRLFEGSNAAQVLEALLQKEPPPLRVRLDDPRLPAVERVVRRMLEKTPLNRFDDLRVAGLALAAAQRGEAFHGSGAENTTPILAVTDFRNITANAEDDWLGTGISETVTADLEGFEGVTMVPRGRVSELVRTLERQRGDQGEALWMRVGRELGARWVLTGSFQRAADAVRVTAYLLDSATAHVERTIKVDGRMDEIFALQDRLVRDLAGLLRAVIRPTEATTLETGVVGAYEAFSKGVINLRAESYESLDRAVMLFEQAVDLDAGYARAHLELGVAYATKADYLARGELRKQAVTSLRRALELQPDSVRAWRELGLVLMASGQDSDGFEAMRRALAIDPADAGALAAMGRALFIGRADFKEAASWYERALAANPNAGWYALQLSHCAALLRDFVRGEAAASRAIELQQAALSGQERVLIVGASIRLGHLRALQGRNAEAIAAYMQELEFLNGIDHALRSRVNVELNVRLGAAHLSLGETRKGNALLDAAIEAFDQRVRLGADEPFTRYYAAAAHALKGDADTAIAFLERAAAVRRPFTIERARIEPEFAALRKDVRLQRLLSTELGSRL
jgi:TolB-like protein/tetratricopeptide (TPR) repeat protein